MTRRPTLIAVVVLIFSAGALSAAPQVEPRLVGRWEYHEDGGLSGQSDAHIDLRADGTFEYVAVVVIQAGSYVTGSRYAQAYKYQGRYRASGGTVLFFAIGKGKLVEQSNFDNFVERINKLETKNDRASDREYRWMLDSSGDAVRFAAIDGGTDQSKDLNSLIAGPFHRKK